LNFTDLFEQDSIHCIMYIVDKLK